MEKLNQWLQLLTNVGVLASIAFLAVEIEQNSDQLRLASYQVSTERYADLMSNVLEDSDNFIGFRHALNCFSSSKPEYQALFHSQVNQIITAIEHSQQLLEAGVIPESVLLDQKVDLASILKSPGGKQYMNETGRNPESSFYKDVFLVGAQTVSLNSFLFLQATGPDFCRNDGS